MLPEYETQIEFLKTRWWSYRSVYKFYGVGFPLQVNRTQGKIVAWKNRFHPNEDLFKDPQLVNCFLLERYFQWAEIIPVKWAAVRLGMTKDSFEAVLARMNDLSILDFTLQTQQFVSKRMIENFRTFFPSSYFHRGEEHNEHNDFCAQLHHAIRDEFNIDVIHLKCVTSAALGESPSDFSYDFDSITGEPLGLKYQVWLDFGKPHTLAPTACSLLFYAQNEKELKQYLFNGREPTLPDALLKYTERRPRRCYELICEYPFGTVVDIIEQGPLFGLGNYLKVRPLDTSLGLDEKKKIEVCSREIVDVCGKPAIKIGFCFIKEEDQNDGSN